MCIKADPDTHQVQSLRSLAKVTDLHIPVPLAHLVGATHCDADKPNHPHTGSTKRCPPPDRGGHLCSTFSLSPSGRWAREGSLVPAASRGARCNAKVQAHAIQSGACVLKPDTWVDG